MAPYMQVEETLMWEEAGILGDSAEAAFSSKYDLAELPAHR